MIKRLNHANITVPGEAEEEARQFYCGLLGLQEVEKPEPVKANGGFWTQLGDVQVHISLQDGVDRAASTGHLAFEVEDLEACRALFRKQGIEVHEEPKVPGYNRINIRDPFGNRLEFMERE